MVRSVCWFVIATGLVTIVVMAADESLAPASIDMTWVAATIATVGAIAIVTIRLGLGWADDREQDEDRRPQRNLIRERRDRLVAETLRSAQVTWLTLFMVVITALGIRAAYADHMLFERQRLCAELGVAEGGQSRRPFTCSAKGHLTLELRR